MPGLEELACYLRGLWLLVRGQPAGASWLDLSERGFWRSWWAIVFCLPPTLISWLSFKASYASFMPDNAPLPDNFFAKLTVIEASGWLTTTVVLAFMSMAAGLGRFAIPLIVVANWLSVPLQWSYSPVNALQILVPGSDGLLAILYLAYLGASIFAHYMVISTVLGGNRAVAAVTVAGLFIGSYATQYQLMALFGLWPS